MIDLHTHSTQSDGTVPPAEVVRLAKAAGLTAVALTDHDSTAGVAEALEAGRQLGIEVVPGLELAIHGPITVHFVGLFVDCESAALKARLEQVCRLRRERNLAILDRLRAAGYRLEDEALRQDTTRTATRANIGKLLVDAGYETNVSDAIDRHLKRGGDGFVESRRLPADECLTAIRAAGGIPVLCHINQINLPVEELDRYVASFREMGLMGIEAEYTEYDSFWREKARALAKKYGLLLSGGSDFHGSIKKNRVGTGFSDLQVPDVFLERMKQAIGR